METRRSCRLRRMPLRPVYLAAALGILFWCCAWGSGTSSSEGVQPGDTAWRPLRVGAGGWVTGIDISADGATRVVRTDTYGAYVWDSTAGQWVQLVATGRMPAADNTVDNHAGAYEIRVAPSLSTRLFMSYRGRVYRSDDRGASWSRTAFTYGGLMDANDPFRTWGGKMAVDPANPDVVYVGTPDSGLFVTADGGTTWQTVAAVPVSAVHSSGTRPGITGIAFDRTSGLSGGRTKGIYATSYGNGTWRSTDAGASWKRISGGALGGPNSARDATVGADGVYYATTGEAQNGKPNGVWKYGGSGWTDINPGNQFWQTVAADPFDPARLVIGSDGGFLRVSGDRGASWSDIVWKVNRVAPDIPWLAWTDESYMSNGAMRFDPGIRNKLWFAEGIGVWYSTAPDDASAVTWTSQSRGIEQLVANAITAPPGGMPVLASWDRALFTITDPDAFPATHGATYRFNCGWQVDYASTDPSFVVAFVSDVRGGVGPYQLQASYSADRGRTWTQFPTMPLDSQSSWGTFGFGTGAASTPDNFIWVPSNKRAPYYTKDRAQTWNKIALPGVPDTPDGWEGLHPAYYLGRHIVAADRVTAGTFYMYHTPKGLFRSADGGDTWALAHPGEIAPFSGFNARLKAVPGHAGHLFFTSGHQGGSPNPAPAGYFKRSVDGGATWSSVPNVLEAYDFAFGKELAPGGYPTIYIVGWVKGVYGIWRSTDDAASWTRIGDFPLGSLDHIKVIEGDKNVYGTVYVGFNGSGYAYGFRPSGTPGRSGPDGAGKESR